jgi:peptidoglycan/LPS O-acetylase OafA/YrhL
MRISLVFPLLYAIVARLGIRGNLCTGAGLLALDFTWATLADHEYLAASTYDFTFHYTLLFWAGSVIFQFRDALTLWWAEQRNAPIAILGGAGFLLFNYGSSIDKVLSPDAMRTVIIADWLSGAGAVIFVVFALCSAPLVRFLSTRTMRFFGTISYSLYLAHGIILIAVLQRFYGVVPLAILLPACAAASVGISLLSFTVIEKPFMRFGKRITSRT